MPKWTLLIFIYLLQEHVSCLSPWRWECENEKCVKKENTHETEHVALSLAACQMYCSVDSGLWPKPTGQSFIEDVLFPINPNKIEIDSGRSRSDLVNKAAKLFKEDLQSKTQNHAKNLGRTLSVKINLEDPEVDQLTLETNESYKLSISQTSDQKVEAQIDAPNFFGSRHALETLGQLIVFDDLRYQLLIPSNVSITDKPAYPYRGILLDTARNFVSLDVIKKTINGMAASKLNTFHWHITDSHSFPYVSKSHPELSNYGAYSPLKVYSPSDIEDVISFAKERGIRVLPEFDAPAHVGEGWQNTSLVVCFNSQPWTQYCVEPPCGQFDPTQEGLYDFLEDIYGDMIEQFKPDIFHMGGDEVHFGCWNSSQSIVDWMKKQGWETNESDFVKLWDQFQEKALERLYKKAGKNIPVIMWTSTLTKKEYLKYLPKEKYIIQIWTTAQDETVQNLLDNDYKVIISNYDALYLDCGFSGWVTDGNNWCSPYHGWQKVYENKPALIGGSRKNQILGSEATLWSEQVDSTSIDSRLWPRAAAMAEVLWSEPTTSWREAEQRMLLQRERLVNRGINADALEPEWCLQNEGQCPMNSL